VSRSGAGRCSTSSMACILTSIRHRDFRPLAPDMSAEPNPAMEDPVRRVISARSPVLIALTIGQIGLARQPPHVSRWELTEPFVRDVWLHPIRNMDVTIVGAGPVHVPAEDFEIHIGAEFGDATKSATSLMSLSSRRTCAKTAVSPQRPPGARSTTLPATATALPKA
jgi:hypothetical protein